MTKKKKWLCFLAGFLLICVAVMLFHVSPMVRSGEEVELTTLEFYRGGKMTEVVTDARKLSALGGVLRMTGRTMLPTVSGSQRLDSAPSSYYKIYGKINGEDFTIFVDQNGAHIDYPLRKGLSYRIENGAELINVITPMTVTGTTDWPPKSMTENIYPFAVMYEGQLYVMAHEPFDGKGKVLKEAGVINGLVPANRLPEDDFQTNYGGYMGATLWTAGDELVVSLWQGKEYLLLNPSNGG